MGNNPQKNDRDVRANLEKIKASKLVKAFKNIVEIKDNIDKLDKDKVIKVYLISLNTIPKFKGLIKKHRKTLEAMKENEKIEESLQKELANYETGDDIKLYNSFKICEELKKKENDGENEFIFANEEILKILNNQKNIGKYLEIINEENIKYIKFPVSLSRIGFSPKNDDCLSFKFEEKNLTQIIYDEKKKSIVFPKKDETIKDVYEGNSSLSLAYTSSVLKIIDDYKKNVNKYINDTLDLFPLLYCLSNINILATYFAKNKEDFKNSNKIVSKAFSEIICELAGNNNLKGSTSFEDIQNLLGNNIEKYECSKLIKFLYNKIHNELNEKNFFVNNEDISSCGNELTTELNKIRNSFKNNNKSIISDNFYYEFVNIGQCMNCPENIFKCSMKNTLSFVLEKVLDFKSKSKKGEYFENVDIYDCFGYLINGHNNLKCPKCNNDCLNSSYMNSLPRILTIILDRNNNFENGIEFGLDFTIDLKNYLYKWGIMEEKNTKFELIGMLTYFSKENGSDHSAIYKSAFNNNWYFYKNSNNNIEIINGISEAYKGLPYLLFYQKI